MTAKPSKRKSPRQRPKKKHAVIGSFGAATVLWGEGLGVRVEMFKGDIGRIIDAMEEYFASIQDEQAAKAAKTLAEKVGRQTTHLRISMDVVIAGGAAELKPILSEHPTKCGYGTRWEE